MRGVIYVATGAGYRDLAVASATSLRAHEPHLQIDIFTDDLSDPALAIFDQVHLVDNPEPRSKLLYMQKTRFDHTLFLDADTLVVAPLGDVFDLLQQFDMALAHEVRRNGTLVNEGLEEQTPRAFSQLNSGVLLYRRTPAVLAFLAEWHQRFKAAGVPRDQIILKDMLWRTDLRYYVLPPEFNLRRVTELDAIEPLDMAPTVLHSHRLMDHMRAGAPRISDPAALMRAERAMLVQEWRDAGAPLTEDDDALARFRAARPAGALPPLRPAGDK
ncbi:hypothetical protein BVG79_00104 [Ketogulonicigenium robustum]|uniref:Nucleotide-diphospho-sugar transferase domain-containing protein n=1 Tax=Ketogulonicigenium robustum TaxID=92947 RepID=A0A1W6NW82_9RHOB|nr:hypothetical protein [Ketogulonicigenium robustum]ARO13464.1 hypothetical protein BVG79_00104 [Ketogulonicigenium robustum]